MSVCTNLKELVNYAVSRRLIEETDRAWAINRLMEALKLSDFTDDGTTPAERPLEEILGDLCDYAFENGLMEGDSVVYRDLFDTSLMGLLTPRPSEVINTFWALYKESPEKATNYFYDIARKSDYIRT